MDASGSLVNLATVPDVKQQDTSTGRVEFVEHSVITNAEPEFVSACQPVMGKRVEPSPHLVHLVFNGLLNLGRQSIKATAECWRPDLKGGRHGYCGCRVRYLPSRISSRAWSSLVLSSSLSSS